MSLGRPDWQGRRKRATRRLARDLRQLGPAIAVVLCLVGSATAIVAVESGLLGTAPRATDPVAPPLARDCDASRAAPADRAEIAP